MNIRSIQPSRHRGAVPVSHDPLLWMDQVFGDLFGRNTFVVPPAGLAPKLDTFETEEELRFEAELPGVSAQDLEILVEDGVLTLRGEKKDAHSEEGSGRRHSERHYGKFERRIQLRSEVDEAKAEATFKGGVLTLRLPKKPEERPQERRIEVRVDD